MPPLDASSIAYWHETIANRLADEAVGLCYPQHPKWEGVTLVAVTKYATAEQMVGAFQAGLTHFAESRPVEALEKRATLPLEITNAVTWHFIGHLQRNKVNKVVGQYSLIHSVDSLNLLEAIAAQARLLHTTQDVLLQINISGEASKHGFTPEETPALVEKSENMDGIRVLGLMTMAPKEATPAQQATIFGKLQALRGQLESQFSKNFPISSMGMTQDYSQALLEGATIVRIGNKLFT